MEFLDLEPEVPVKETWEWKTDVLESYDGTEQRISLRGEAPRYMVDLSLLATEDTDLNTTWQRLIASRSQAWVPEYHRFVETTTDAALGANRLYFDPDQTDIRVGEYLAIRGDGVYLVTTAHSDGASISPNLAKAAPAKSIVAPVDILILDNQPSVSRGRSNTVGKFSLRGRYNRARATLTRPGISETLTIWNDIPVLDVRPLANEEVSDIVIEDNIIIDNDIGLVSIINKWNQAKTKTSKSFLVNRYENSCSNEGVRSQDFWREFLSYCRGSAKKIWLPTYRDDLICVENPDNGGDSILVEGFVYAQTLFFDQDTYIYLEIETEQGTHRCVVTSVGSVGNNTQCNFVPALPSGYVDVTRISFLLPSRLEGDSIEWQHHQLHSIISLNLRTSETVEIKPFQLSIFQVFWPQLRDSETGTVARFQSSAMAFGGSQRLSSGATVTFENAVLGPGDGVLVLYHSTPGSGTLSVTHDGDSLGSFSCSAASGLNKTAIVYDSDKTESIKGDLVLSASGSCDILQVIIISQESRNTANQDLMRWYEDIAPLDYSATNTTLSRAADGASLWGHYWTIAALSNYVEYEIWLPGGTCELVVNAIANTSSGIVTFSLDGVDFTPVDFWASSTDKQFQTVVSLGTQPRGMKTLRATISGTSHAGYQFSWSWMRVKRTGGVSAGSASEQTITLWPWAEQGGNGNGPVITGAYANTLYYNVWGKSSPALGDKFSWSHNLEAGSYKAKWVGAKRSSGGIIDLTVNDGDSHLINTYISSGGDGTVINVSDIDVEAGNIQLEVVDKNPSSTTPYYDHRLNYLKLIKAVV